MTATTTRAEVPASAGTADRFRLHRAGILNVWQYDDQVFEFADGRLLLRGANGAGKSKTLEMLLPFALDGDKARITASAKHHTSLLWLMTDGMDAGNRIGYMWVEFRRVSGDGVAESFTCGVGIRASSSARSATAWHFATNERVGIDFSLEDDAGPLPMARLRDVLGPEHVFERAGEYKTHVGRTLFGLPLAQYEEVLRLLYWLRQPQVGEDIEPAKLTAQLSQALPQLDEQAVQAAGDTFDELTAFGEQIERRTAAARELAQLAKVYGRYARAAVAARARALAAALHDERRLRSEVRVAKATVESVRSELDQAQGAQVAARAAVEAGDAALRVLEASPEFRAAGRLIELDDRARDDAQRAEAAQRRHAKQAEAVAGREQTERKRARESEQRIDAHRARLRELDQRQRDAVPGSGVATPSVLDEVKLDQVDRVPMLLAALDHVRNALSAARSAVSQRLAGVALVRQALDDLEQRTRDQRHAEDQADSAEGRWESARTARLVAQKDAEVQLDGLTRALHEWAAEPGVPRFVLTAELTAQWLRELPAAAQTAAAPHVNALLTDQAQLAARRDSALGEVARLTAERTAVAAQRDPAPPLPPLPRTERADGAALWRVIDFVESVPDDARASIEAALQSAGLLDAWLRPGGQLLDPDHRDVVLSAGPRDVQDGGLNAALVPDLPDGCGLVEADVQRVLAAISMDQDDQAPASISLDGAWRLGPAHGRSEKPRAQYIGATARAAERARRLAALDAAIASAKADAEGCERVVAALAAAVDGLRAWAAVVPSGASLLEAWIRLDEKRGAEEREEEGNRLAQSAAHEAREVAAAARSALERVAREQELPAVRSALDAVEQAVRSLDEGLREAERSDQPIRDGLARWQEALAELAGAREALADETVHAEEAAGRANAARAEYEALRDSVGDSVDQLQNRIAEVKRSRSAHLTDERAAETRVKELIHASGEADQAAKNIEVRLAEHVAHRAEVLATLVEVGAAPGLVQAAGIDEAAATVIASLAGHPVDQPVGRSVATTIDELAGLSADDEVVARNAVWGAHNDATSGPAADHLPTVLGFGELLAVSGRDDVGEAPVVTLAARVHAGVDRDRELLTDREKQQFEQHVLGELGDAIRACRRDAEELVRAMNTQLEAVTTSQGIRVRLDWRLRDDVPAEARVAVGLLVQPVGALIPEERAQLRDALHKLIDASRVERPELSYSEHLAAALDYRTWSTFTIRYTRPETPDHWERLHKRSPLSQGEQKVLCYLPLFAAAAAHFTSLAGAAPHAPRLVLLDDAFPKIDVRTHPLLFGLLVHLDLDFVITSERLWGDHPTVPSLAIYEALRDPGQRGIAQYEYRWDGRVLQGIG